MSRAAPHLFQFRLRTIFLATAASALLFATLRFPGAAILLVLPLVMIACGVGVLYCIDFLSGDEASALSPLWMLMGAMALTLIVFGVLLIVTLLLVVLGMILYPLV